MSNNANEDWLIKRPTKLEPVSIVLVGGCFDLIHQGHLFLLKKAKALGGKLLVGVLSDKYIKTYKGEKRPIQDEDTRKEIVKNLKQVDEVLVTDKDPYSLDVLEKIKPQVIIFGATKKNILELENKSKKITQKFPQIETLFLKRKLGSVSTTKIIEKIKTG